MALAVALAPDTVCRGRAGECVRTGADRAVVRLDIPGPAKPVVGTCCDTERRHLWFGGLLPWPALAKERAAAHGHRGQGGLEPSYLLLGLTRLAVSPGDS